MLRFDYSTDNIVEYRLVKVTACDLSVSD